MDLKKLSVREIEDLLNNSSLKKMRSLIIAANKDYRKGVRRLAAKKKKTIDHQFKEEDLYFKMTGFERSLWSEGYRNVAGIDEVGRGCLAGPLVSAAVILPDDASINGLRDSKTLTAAKREKLAEAIKEIAVSFEIVVIDRASLDRYGLHRANLMALTEAAIKLSPPADYLLIDGYDLKLCPIPQKKLIKGDNLSVSIAAASILAKVYRDALMEELDSKHPGYGFRNNKGYGTKEHLEALATYGPCDEHRRSFSPVARWNEHQLSLTGENE